MKPIENLKEKRLLVTRKIIIAQMEPKDENIVSVWCELFPADRMRLGDVELFAWVRKHVNSSGVKYCNEQLEKMRRKGARKLKEKGKYKGYGAKLVKQPKDKLATYDIFTKGKKYSGNYESLCGRLGRLPI